MSGKTDGTENSANLNDERQNSHEISNKLSVTYELSPRRNVGLAYQLMYTDSRPETSVAYKPNDGLLNYR